jgi:hypothetical protein
MIRHYLLAAAAAIVLTACAPSDPDSSADAPAPEIVETADAAAPTIEIDTTTSGDEIVEDAPVDIETIGYPDGWEMIPYWSGEYPSAFSVTMEGVTVMGHETITYGVYPPIYCGLPYKATFSPWNSERFGAGETNFVTMVFPTTFTINEDATIEAFITNEVEPTQLALKTGDQLIYKSYMAEGYFIAEKDGVLYEMNETDLPESTEFTTGPDDQEWVLVTCADGDSTRAWVLYEDAINAQGVIPYEYTGFGEAADLP